MTANENHQPYRAMSEASPRSHAGHPDKDGGTLHRLKPSFPSSVAGCPSSKAYLQRRTGACPQAVGQLRRALLAILSVRSLWRRPIIPVRSTGHFGEGE